MSIPGVSSRYNTQKLIADLMEVERQKLTRLETEKTQYQDMKTVWQGLSRRMQTLRDATRKLYGFESPFLNKIGESTQAGAVTLSPTRAAVEGQWKLKVLQVATADRFMSKELPLDATAPAGDYLFRVGDKEITVPFRGGRLNLLVDAINARGRDYLRSSLIRTTAESQVMTIESLKLGSANRLEFLGPARDWSVQAGLMAPNTSADRIVPLSASASRVLSAPNSVTFENNTAVLGPGSRLTLPVDAEIKPGMMLEFTVRGTPITAPPQGEVPPGLQLPTPGTVEFQDIRIRNNPLRTGFPNFTPSTPPPEVRNPKVGTVLGAPVALVLPDFPLTAEEKTIQVPLAGMTRMEGLQLENKNTGISYTLSNIRIFDPNARGELAPVNAQSNAMDAVFELDGVRVTRGTNTIDDVITGVTINVNETTPAPATVKVTPDYESIKEGMIQFVGNYNRFLVDLLTLTSRNESVINEATYLTDTEREELRKNIGKLQGDVTLTQLRSSLQRILMDGYPTGNPALSLLHQAGISTNASGSTGGNPEASRLRGYLEINEAKLDQVMRENLNQIKNLFGVDTNGDLVIDNGAAYKIEEYLKPYLQTGGFLPARVTNLDSNIARQDREINEYNNYLVRYEQDLKRKYGAMEGALNRMESTGQAIDNFSRQNGGGN